MENEHAWRVPVDEIVGRGYNLDIKNPNAPNDAYGDPDKLLKKYREILAQIDNTRETLKKELAASLERS